MMIKRLIHVDQLIVVYLKCFIGIIEAFILSALTGGKGY